MSDDDAPVEFVAVYVSLEGRANLHPDDTISAMLERSGIYAGMLIGEVLIESVEEV